MKVKRTNSDLAWKRNAFYGRLVSIKKQLQSINNDADLLTLLEHTHLTTAIYNIKIVLSTRKDNIIEFGKIKGFKKYQKTNE